MPLPALGDLPDPGFKPKSPVSPALAGGFFTIEPPGKPRLLGRKKLKKGDASHTCSYVRKEKVLPEAPGADLHLHLTD